MHIPIDPEMLETVGDTGDQAPSSSNEEPRIRAWVSTQNGVLAWMIPVIVVIITAVLGSIGRTLLVSTWLAAVGASAAGVLIHIALEPARYATKAASAVSAVIGASLLLILAWQAGQPLLK